MDEIISRADARAMAPVRTRGSGKTLHDVTPQQVLQAALASGDPGIVFQPIMDLASGIVTGYEALSRFHSLDGMAPDLVFAEAHRQGAGHDLETLAVAKAIEASTSRPENTVLSLNVSPSTLLTEQFMAVLPVDLTGLQIEITEHEKITDKDRVLSVLRVLRHRGAAIAVDDLGEGYAGLQQLMMLEPDVLKLDRSLVSRAHEVPAKAALIEAISRYALRTGTRVCAEGVECLEELRLLADLDVGEAQGWVIGRPSTTFEQADRAARRACISALSMILEVGDPTEAGDPDLAGVLSRIATIESLDELARLMGWVSALLGCAKTALSVFDPASQTVEAVQPNAWLPNGRRFSLSDFPLTDEVLRRNVVAQVVAGSPGADEAESEFLKHDGFGALLMVPVYSGSHPVGLLECYATAALPWTRHQIRTIRCVAAVTGPVLRNLAQRPR
jgi:EAL domain-containing protein (putative c-di-GMP-specific phosphodiesterase class I)